MCAIAWNTIKTYKIENPNVRSEENMTSPIWVSWFRLMNRLSDCCCVQSSFCTTAERISFSSKQIGLYKPPSENVPACTCRQRRLALILPRCHFRKIDALDIFNISPSWWKGLFLLPEITALAAGFGQINATCAIKLCAIRSSTYRYVEWNH
jgi:hypothetical protein